jgi:hypothetical protein
VAPGPEGGAESNERQCPAGTRASNVRDGGLWRPHALVLMVLDQAMMNVSISQLVEDSDTSVTKIQGIITFDSLVVGMFTITGAKIGDIIAGLTSNFLDNVEDTRV